MQAIRDYFIAPGAIVTGDVVLSAGVNIWYGCVLRGDVARVTLAPRVNLQDGTIVHADYDQPQIIEEGVVVGHAAVLHGIRVGRDTLVGIGARLLAGSEVGEECVIAAGAAK
jgi:carbonic anhydrase/acetyltransferase-like protein (isoleucine patch superfamily)